MSYRWPEKRLGAAAAIFDDRGRVLLVKHSYGPLNWELPGGAVELGESVVEAAVRETQEETGLEVVAKHLSGFYYDTESDAHHFVFVCEPLDAQATPRPDAEEATECALWHPDDLPRPISNFTVLRVTDAASGAEQPLPSAIGPLMWLE